MKNEKRSIQLSLSVQRRRLAELVDLAGGFDPEHPLHRLVAWRIESLEAKLSCADCEDLTLCSESSYNRKSII